MPREFELLSNNKRYIESMYRNKANQRVLKKIKIALGYKIISIIILRVFFYANGYYKGIVEIITMQNNFKWNSESK